MLEASKVIESVIGTSGTLAKQQILLTNKDNTILRSILQFIYDPYNKCRVGAKRLLSTMHQLDGHKFIANDKSVDNIIKFLTENNTGSDEAITRAAKFVLAIDQTYNSATATYVAIALVTQDLKMGISTKTLNQIYGASFIPVVGCMLGTLYSDVSHPKWPCVVTEKLDGIRRVLIKHEGTIRMFSRSGHEDTGLVDIIEEAKVLPDGYVYDGELIALGDFADNIACRQATSSIANSKGERHGIGFNVFDMLPVEEFYTGTSKDIAINRKARLAATFGDDSLQIIRPDDWLQLQLAFNVEHDFTYIKPVPILGHVKYIEEVDPIVEEIWKKHGEGVMLNSDNGLYEVKRSKDLMKVKFVTEVTLPVVGFTEGTGRNSDTLGSIVVDYKGAKVGVGSGFADYQRDEIWNNQEKYIGKQVEIETFGESTNLAGGISLNCPIFKRFVGEVE